MIKIGNALIRAGIAICGIGSGIVLTGIMIRLGYSA